MPCAQRLGQKYHKLVCTQSGEKLKSQGSTVESPEIDDGKRSEEMLERCHSRQNMREVSISCVKESRRWRGARNGSHVESIIQDPCHSSARFSRQRHQL
ncbi:hypothetical protein DL93DRAFT_804963 [Clavulina sp. PMI_390]|nr:hypothetical protein DL93DRAFT_804963 [Clavulina sp. PMI_390]